MIKIYAVDAFTDTLFQGNQAAVCPLETWLPDDVLQSIATENNLSETAFIVGGDGSYDIRWFTPKVEVDLCGHATLASAWVVFNTLEPGAPKVDFVTREAGPLSVVRNGDLLELDFPSRSPEAGDVPDGLVAALGSTPKAVLQSRDSFCVFETEDDVRALTPDFAALEAVDTWGVIATAPGDGDIDFVSRFFAPRQGIAEDPVTGSAHCSLTPYWANHLGKTSLEARQVSARGGKLSCTLRGDRVGIAGYVTPYMEGRLHGLG